jgi:glutamate carboxypeptidase
MTLDPYFMEIIDNQYDASIDLITKWANINSGTQHLAGLAKMLATLRQDFSSFKGEEKIHFLSPYGLTNAQGERMEIQVGQAYSLRKRAHAPIQVLLAGHMDTVYGVNHPFQRVKRVDRETLQGPGVTDMKGGLVVLLRALEILERSPVAKQIGWEVIINPDEEVGSPSSAYLFEEAAKRHHVGLIFEPSFPDGAFVSWRKGSLNYTIVTRGQAAHVGRDFHVGKNAIYALTEVIQQLEKLNENPYHTTLNVGQIEGGGPINVVPHLALCRLNIRVTTSQEMFIIKEKVQDIVAKCCQSRGQEIYLIEDSVRFPKPFDPDTRELFFYFQQCAADLKLPFHLRESGGVCDGNLLATAGLPTIDSIGVVGGKIHTDEEYLILPSLRERIQLTALFLLRLAKGEIPISKERLHV